MMCAWIHLDLLADRISSIEIISIEQNECPLRARARAFIDEDEEERHIRLFDFSLSLPSSHCIIKK